MIGASQTFGCTGMVTLKGGTSLLSSAMADCVGVMINNDFK